MKFLFISPVVWNFYPLQNQNLASALADKGHPVVYANPLSYRNHKAVPRFAQVNALPVPDGLELVTRNTRMKRSMAAGFLENISNTRLIHRNKPDVVVCYDHLGGLLPCLYCRLKGITFIFNMSDDWDHVPQKPLPRLVWKSIIKPLVTRFSNAVACISHKQLRLMKKQNKNSFLLPNGLISDFIEAIERAPVNSGPPVVNFIAHLRDWYDFDLLFDVFSALPDIQLNIYGTGPLYETLRDKASTIPNISLKGSVPHQDTAVLLKNTWIGVLPLKNNILNDSTCPVKLFDYWAAGKAVVATPTEELTALGADCLFFADDRASWIQCIQMLANAPEKVTAAGNTGRQKVSDTYHYEALCIRFLNQIETLKNK